MGLMRSVGSMLFLSGVALAGNWVGTQMRAAATGEPMKQASIVQTTPSGQTKITLNITLTNLVPALALSMLAGKPRSVYAFISGAVISALVGDTYERMLPFKVGQLQSHSSADDPLSSRM